MEVGWFISIWHVCILNPVFIHQNIIKYSYMIFTLNMVYTIIWLKFLIRSLVLKILFNREKESMQENAHPLAHYSKFLQRQTLSQRSWMLGTQFRFPQGVAVTNYWNHHLVPSIVPNNRKLKSRAELRVEPQTAI